VQVRSQRPGACAGGMLFVIIWINLGQGVWAQKLCNRSGQAIVHVEFCLSDVWMNCGQGVGRNINASTIAAARRLCRWNAVCDCLDKLGAGGLAQKFCNRSGQAIVQVGFCLLAICFHRLHLGNKEREGQLFYKLVLDLWHTLSTCKHHLSAREGGRGGQLFCKLVVGLAMASGSRTTICVFLSIISISSICVLSTQVPPLHY